MNLRGLDVVSIRQLVVLLRLLSRQGRTIICTIHQPSASLFALFDRVYVLARGMCCYQGAAPLLVPFLTEVGHVCPTTHNPADFVLETLVTDVEAPAQMSELCQNGKLCRKLDRMTVRGGRKPVLHSDDSIQRIFVEHVAKEQLQKMEFPTTFFTQFAILTKRMFLQNKRNLVSLYIQLAHHVVSAVLLGSIFFQVGNNANVPVVNFKFCLSCLVFFMYTYIMIPVLLFPMEVRLLRREYFNRWYSLKAYYTALTFSSLPSMLILGFIFQTICYVMSGQLMEWQRFLLFSLSGYMTALCSEGLGLAVGAAFSSTLMEWQRFLLFSLSGYMTALCSEGLGLAVGAAFSSTVSLEQLLTRADHLLRDVGPADGVAALPAVLAERLHDGSVLRRTRLGCGRCIQLYCKFGTTSN
ncbi:ABC-2 type transporter domain-containing protein [Phthorimaea operculella]|nr:ABC-2 type transporter domain-containing protein [Phthorimaea operculella]